MKYFPRNGSSWHSLETFQTLKRQPIRAGNIELGREITQPLGRVVMLVPLVKLTMVAEAGSRRVRQAITLIS